ncbi:hypothetical protein BD779DRAFT_736280 [Infundibulicybe gibba]|nr:hypothetical protein BD779DRAFT_736280 [Infundibulicybe gibba]
MSRPFASTFTITILTQVLMDQREGQSSTASLRANQSQNIVDKLATIQRSLEERAQNCTEAHSVRLTARQQEEEQHRALKVARDEALAKQLADISESREQRVRGEDSQDNFRRDELLQLIRDNHATRLNEMASVVEGESRSERRN